jgi:hypothetical protein
LATNAVSLTFIKPQTAQTQIDRFVLLFLPKFSACRPPASDPARAFDPAAIALGHDDAVNGCKAVNAALNRTKDFVDSTFPPVKKITVCGD